MSHYYLAAIMCIVNVPFVLAHPTHKLTFSESHSSVGQGRFHPIAVFLHRTYFIRPSMRFGRLLGCCCRVLRSTGSRAPTHARTHTLLSASFFTDDRPTRKCDNIKFLVSSSMYTNAVSSIKTINLNLFWLWSI